ncbi:thiosulfate sulfurtransferase GlpE [Marinospirillum insulare]|uniref:Thiosulfate sulfurtransferase GlpE n=1 Tax=Marinospirillum insulare TaxID=217169 RepID=A0ABQ5ZSS8_9GAMM|nr:thiosulfate sulfurtransferase GlpE [Marinospirillum insulare]GLR63019.1 thiosulfate sulfurtransferase GlpE [Marinospirillum insulare]
MTTSTMNAQQACELLKEGKLKVVDIRDPHSYSTGRIKTAERLDNSNLQEFINNNAKDQPVLVCCYHGMASQGATDFLKAQGFTEVYSLDGGFEFWKVCHPEHCE